MRTPATALPLPALILNTTSPLTPLCSISFPHPVFQVFARGQDWSHPGLTPGFLLGPRHQELVRGRGPRHRGNYAGRVVKVRCGGEGVDCAILLLRCAHRLG